MKVHFWGRSNRPTSEVQSPELIEPLPPLRVRLLPHVRTCRRCAAVDSGLGDATALPRRWRTECILGAKCFTTEDDPSRAFQQPRGKMPCIPEGTSRNEAALQASLSATLVSMPAKRRCRIPTERAMIEAAILSEQLSNAARIPIFQPSHVS